MKKILVILFFLIITFLAVFLLLTKYHQNKKNDKSETNQSVMQNTAPQEKSLPKQEDISQNFFNSPLDRSKERVSKKPFGIYITPATSPVQPERFQGYHTGTDFEIFSEELNADVEVHAVCSGKLLVKKYASGYGGVAAQSCMLDGNLITIVYGHLKLASINFKTGENINAGDIIGILGKGYSVETDGERKHLHLGFHQGAEVDIKGYVQNQSELSNWIDPCLYVCI